MKRQKMKRAKRTLSARSLVALGVGAIIGAGLFSLTGIAAAENAGPAVTLSFIAAVGCAFAGLCYAEFASMIPVAEVLTRTHMPQWANLLLG
jgi:APA family basic amino acid/polyamine antiporter